MHAEETRRRLKATASLVGLHCAQYCLYCTSAAREALSEPPPPLSLPSSSPFITIHQVSLGHASLLCSLLLSGEVGEKKKAREMCEATYEP